MAWRIDTRMLRMIIAVADSSTLVAAASRLNITPSALSHQIRNTEAMLRVSLFERVGRRVSLTSLGAQLLGSARIIVAELERAEDTLERSRRGEQSTVRLGGGAYPIHRWFLPRQATGCSQWSQVDFISSTKEHSLARAVALGELDMAFAGSSQHERGVLALPLFTDELVAVFAPDHPLSRHAFVEAKHLSEESYVTYSRVIESGLEDDLLFKPARFAPSEVREASTVEAILDLVAYQGGFSILSRWAVRDSTRSKIAFRPLTKDGIKITWSALLRITEKDNQDLMKIAGFLRHLFDSNLVA